MVRKLLDPAERGRKGGKASLRTMLPEDRQQRARKAVLARWKKTTSAERSEAARRAAQARWRKRTRRSAGVHREKRHRVAGIR